MIAFLSLLARPLGAWPKIVTLLAVMMAGSVQVFAQDIDNVENSCHDETRLVEEVSGVPAHLLTAIARTESGRALPGDRAVSAWPWTVMAEGRGRFLANKSEAVAEVQRLRARGITNIDVGCMQVNLHYHGKAFVSLEEAFDPLSNIAYAAAFLTDLRREVRSWRKAVGYYHSRDVKRSNSYRRKVMTFWRDEQKRAYREDRAVRQARAAEVRRRLYKSQP